MNKEDVLAAVSVLVLSGVLLYSFRHAQSTTDNTDQVSNNGPYQNYDGTGSQAAFMDGPSFYLANQPYFFQAALGNVLPNTNTAAPSSSLDLAIATQTVGKKTSNI